MSIGVPAYSPTFYACSNHISGHRKIGLIGKIANYCRFRSNLWAPILHLKKRVSGSWGLDGCSGMSWTLKVVWKCPLWSWMLVAAWKCVWLRCWWLGRALARPLLLLKPIWLIWMRILFFIYNKRPKDEYAAFTYLFHHHNFSPFILWSIERDFNQWRHNSSPFL